ncbi:hypothetical protein [uncultured Clostridium sp.]|mgnify:FL=1|jgi:hypothetical protein|uniref:hypothetical protein n=1 Tax=uncultured Clostridium sp. TaxID=59620 RepID=UPI0020701809|nr:hypothetical protein [uncultured Clostridium sp.]DAV65716.1 MAG TPA: hypothetical protein [Caudoviricetes sp.]
MNLTDEQIKAIVIKSIKNYLDNDKFDDVYIEANFPEAIIIAIEEEKEKLKQPSNISSMSQGSRSVTYKNTGVGMLSNNVKLLLPKPRNYIVW